MRLRVLGVLLCVLFFSGCTLFGPTDDIYEIGVARVGDSFYIYAPLCDDERIEGIRTFSVSAPSAKGGVSYEDYWVASQPIDQETARGFIRLGYDRAFKVVKLSAEGVLPEELGITIFGSSQSKGRSFEVGTGGFRADDPDIPSYDGEQDPVDVRYAFGLESRHLEILSPGDIRERSKCASDYLV